MRKPVRMIVCCYFGACVLLQIVFSLSFSESVKKGGRIFVCFFSPLHQCTLCSFWIDTSTLKSTLSFSSPSPKSAKKMLSVCFEKRIMAVAIRELHLIVSLIAELEKMFHERHFIGTEASL
jgi:hypothetical protein